MHPVEFLFCRIQNLHISQTKAEEIEPFESFVEFKIYISLKQIYYLSHQLLGFVEFKIYISLKPQIEIWRKKF